ncbi:MAG: hypothetical protein OER77_13505 [Myxococcales bacterium]|nr:hypothetical protein [Myxococcales bacterium]
MDPQKKTWLAINVVGGIAVLGSYAHGLITHPQTRDMLWGSMPDPLKSIYGVTMWLAAAGYLVFMHHVFFRIDTAEARVGQHFGFGVVNTCCAAVVFASALWMPLTFAYLDQPSTALWVLIRADLFIVGIGAVGLIVSVFNLSPRATGWAGVVTILALLLFALQTAFLDAFVWPAFFVKG